MNSNFSYSLATRLADPLSQWTQAFTAFARSMRVALPGVIVSFDAVKQTAVINPALTENIVVDGEVVARQLPQLKDVPVVLPRGGGYSLTLPLAAGDEVLMIFGDMDIGQWWQAGGANNNQIHERRHSLSDGFAIPGPWSQKRLIASYSTSSAQLRNDAGTVVVDLAGSVLTLTAPTVKVNATSEIDLNAPTINITGASAVNISTNTTIDGKPMLTSR